MRKLAIWILTFLIVASTHAQQPGPTKTAMPGPVGAAAVQGGAGPANGKIDVVVDDPAVRDALTKWLLSSSARPMQPQPLDIKVLDSGLQTAIAEWLKKQTNKKEETGFWAKFFDNSAVWGAIGALVGSLVPVLFGFLGKKREEQHELTLEAQRTDNELRRDRAAAEVKLQGDAMLANRAAEQALNLEKLRAELTEREAIRKIRYDRLEKFHAPLWALTQQSSGVADKLFRQIYASRNSDIWGGRPLEFMTVEEARAKHIPTEAELRDPGAPRRLVHILHKGEWHLLRTLDFMPVLLKDKASKQLVGVIVEIGRKMSKLIAEYGGLAAAGEDPPPIFGQYLAHFLILEQIYADPPAEPFEPGSQEVGYFPKDFDGVVREGYRKAKADVAQYETTQQPSPQ